MIIEFRPNFMDKIYILIKNVYICIHINVVMLFDN